MKLRIKGNTLRLRLTQSEVKQFAEQGICSEKTVFGDHSFIYQLHKADVDDVHAEYQLDTVSVAVPDDMADAWANDNESAAIEYTQLNADGSKLLVLIEKDFMCSPNNPRSDESDNFPNPNARNLEC